MLVGSEGLLQDVTKNSKSKSCKALSSAGALLPWKEAIQHLSYKPF